MLVSEVMLQQTQASRAERAYGAFLGRFPSVEVLAAAPRHDVLRAWEGLGYNRRAVALSEAARAIVRDHGARVPREPGALARLPGVGPYTAAAVASIGYGASVAAVDSNVRRVVARAFLGAEPDDASAGRVRDLAARWLDPGDPAAWNQAVMGLGREVCRPRPKCDICPLSAWCWFRREGRGTGPAPRPARRRQPAFEGSFRRVRGRVVKVLRARTRAALRTLAREAGEPLERVARAVAALSAEGLVDAGPAALAGRPGGMVRLAS